MPRTHVLTRILGATALTAACAAGFALTPTGPALAAPEAAHSLQAAAEEPASASLFAGAAQSNGLEVSIDEVAPRILTSENELLVAGTVKNTGSSALPAPVLELSVGAWTPVSAAALESELSSPSPWEVTVSTQVLGAQLESGAESPFEFRVPIDYLPLGFPASWGPRTLTVSGSSQDASGRDRSLMIWDTSQPLAQTRVNALIPWTSQNSRGGDAERRAVLQIAKTPGATLAMDARVLPAPEADADEENAQSGGTRTEAGAASDAQFIDSFYGAASEIVALPEGDACLATLAVTGAEDLLGEALASIDAFPDSPGALAAASADDAAEGEGAESGAGPRGASHSEDSSSSEEGAHRPSIVKNVSWPREELFGTQALGAFADRVTIAPQGALSPVQILDFTPSSVMNVDPATGSSGSGSTVLAPDALLNELLNWTTTNDADELDAEQGLAALTAIITRERPSLSRTLFVAASRTEAPTERLAKRLNALLNARWVAPISFQEATASEASDVERPAADAGAVPEASAEAVTTMKDSLTSLGHLATAASDPEAVFASIDDALPVLSAAVSPEEQRTRANAVRADVAWLRSQVSATPSDAVNLINKSADFPVRVRNDLEWDVEVLVSIVPSDPRLEVASTTRATLKAQSVTSVGVPVTAIGSGNIEVTYDISTPDGAHLTDSPPILVRMRAGWEDALTITAASALAVLFVAGLVRTVRSKLNRAHGRGTHAPGEDA
ncbi:MAG: DUF6049 family protein [Schaalia hyovaginalis]|uniref:DUF6049 family protein n=1 Tax=Schaalia hyovaginalis TaxID=29316 RepID=UPI002A91F190|nr:DUF6049 family protein [Schaalia hyovaginalis]MDY5601732.1 DUF6049 family protein [Schaalia hyovaginalis]